MNSRWDAAATSDLSDLDLLVYASRLIGAETSLVVWGGGNTSVKRVERDHRGRDVQVLRVKGSGSDLKSIQKKDFPGVRMDDILALLERDQMEDQAMVDYFARALLDPSSPRPSIETPLHGFLPVTAVVHTHADAIVSLTNNDRCPDVLKQVYGDQVVSLAYLRPGFPIARQVAQAFAAQSQGARHSPRETRNDLLGRLCEGRLSLDDRADQSCRGSDRAPGGRAVRFGGVEVVSPSPTERRRVAVAVAPPFAAS
jgi:rhamnose utilization protein RhaD (predicted bifunctional aldolase and dehydrogenase)